MKFDGHSPQKRGSESYGTQQVVFEAILFQTHRRVEKKNASKIQEHAGSASPK